MAQIQKEKKKHKPLISTVLKGSRVRTLRLTFSNRLWAALNSNGFKQTLKCFPEGRPKHLGRSYAMASFTFLINPSTRCKLFFHLSAGTWAHRFSHLRLACFPRRSCRNLVGLGWPSAVLHMGWGGPARIRLRHRGPHASPFTCRSFAFPGLLIWRSETHNDVLLRLLRGKQGWEWRVAEGLCWSRFIRGG